MVENLGTSSFQAVGTMASHSEPLKIRADTLSDPRAFLCQYFAVSILPDLVGGYGAGR